MHSRRDGENPARSNTNNGRNPCSNFIQSPPHIQFSTVNQQLFTSPFLTSTYPVNTNMIIPTQPHISHQVHHLTSVQTQHVINSTPAHTNHTLPPTTPSPYPITTSYPSPLQSIPNHQIPPAPYHQPTTSHSPFHNLPLPSQKSIHLNHHHIIPLPPHQIINIPLLVLILN